jgi:protein phosphatase
MLAVADGLGGHPRWRCCQRCRDRGSSPLDRPIEPTDLAAVLGRGINAANVLLRRRVEADSQLAGMATTVVALLVAGSTGLLANVGDSRAYLLRNGETVQITEDRTYDHLVAGAAGVPNLSVRLARFLDGRLDGRSPDLTAWDLRPGDRFLLCSDGLSSSLPHGQIHVTLSSPASPDEAADQLIALAIEEGGSDNITVIVVDVR